MRYLGIVFALSLAACAEAQPDAGHELYMGYCVSCHGSGGQGDGVLAEDLALAPANLTGLASANDGVFPSSRVMAKIYGYPGRYQSHVMPEFGPVLEGPKVMWTDENGQAIETPKALLDLHDYLVSIQTP